MADWIGRQVVKTDTLTPAPVAALSAALNCEQSPVATDSVLPDCWHWLYFQEPVATSALGSDGHPERGDFLPPVLLPRRMWAGSRLQFLQPLFIGEEIRRVSTITDVAEKKGASGELVFVTVQHELFRGEALTLREEQDIVYRGAPAAGSAVASASGAGKMQWGRVVTPDPVLLFRYSALTFNSHRIHYDLDYATRVEGYPGLVVQGPLTATMLLETLRRELPGVRLHSFSFRGTSALFAGNEIQLQGMAEDKLVRMQALNPQGIPAMQASAELHR